MEIEFVPAPIHKRKGKGFKVTKKYLPEKAYLMHSEKGFNKGHIYDFAVLELECEFNLEEYFGSFGYNFNPTEYLFKETYQNMQVLGYPYDYQYKKI